MYVFRKRQVFHFLFPVECTRGITGGPDPTLKSIFSDFIFRGKLWSFFQFFLYTQCTLPYFIHKNIHIYDHRVRSKMWENILFCHTIHESGRLQSCTCFPQSAPGGARAGLTPPQNPYFLTLYLGGNYGIFFNFSFTLSVLTIFYI